MRAFLFLCLLIGTHCLYARPNLTQPTPHSGDSPAVDTTNNRPSDYLYRLAGEEEGWHTLEPEITLSDLSYGEHTLEVCPRLADSNRPLDSTFIHLHILPPWWLSGYALAGYGTLLVLIGLGWTYYRRRRPAITPPAEPSPVAPQPDDEIKAFPTFPPQPVTDQPDPSLPQPDPVVADAPTPASDPEPAPDLEANVQAAIAHIPPLPSTHPLTPEEEDFLQRLTNIVLDNLTNEQFDMAFVIKRMETSQSTMYRRVKFLTGLTSNEFVRRTRLRHCLRLMLEKSYNVSEAAYACGFNDLAYFRICFRNAYGMSATDYKRVLLTEAADEASAIAQA